MIEENKEKVGYGSWYACQSFKDYDFKELYDFYRYTRNKCLDRFKSLGIEKGDMIKITVISGYKPIKYLAIFSHYIQYDEIILLQKKREFIVACKYIDDVEIIEKYADLKV